MQALDHAQAQAPLTIEHFGHAATRPKKGFEVTRSQTLLLHAELDGFHGVSRAEVIVPVLIGFDQSHQHIPLVRLRRLLFGLEDGLQPAEYRLEVVVITDRLTQQSPT